MSSGDSYLVELEEERVLAAEGPVDPAGLTALDQAWSAPALGRSAAFTRLAADLERRRDEFERKPLSAP